MNCPLCASNNVKVLDDKTHLGYQRYRCRSCCHYYNERSGTPYNYLEYPTDVVFLVVIYRLRYKLSLRDIAEIFLERGIVLTHECVREWEERFSPILTQHLREKRKGKAGKSWYVDETYIKVKGKWCYLYRSLDTEGELIDVYLSPSQDKEAVKAFFASAISVVGHEPDRITSGKHAAYPEATKESFEKEIQHRTIKFLNNNLEQSHRGIKGRYYPMKGFKNFTSAFRFCRGFDELKNYLRAIFKKNQLISLGDRRLNFTTKIQTLRTDLSIA